MAKRQCDTLKSKARGPTAAPPPPGGCTTKKLDVFGPRVQVCQRDASFNATGRGGSAGKYHWAAHGGGSACSDRRRLMLDAGKSPDSVPAILRCRAAGCRTFWGLWDRYGSKPVSR